MHGRDSLILLCEGHINLRKVQYLSFEHLNPLTKHGDVWDVVRFGWTDGIGVVVDHARVSVKNLETFIVHNAQC